MSDGAIVFTWGQPVRGRERQALEVFREALAYYQRLQQAGEIESFESFALEAHGGSLNGFILVRGDPERLLQLRSREEFMRLSNRTTLVVEHFGIHSAVGGESMQRLYADWGAQASDLLAARSGGETGAHTPT